ncbi:MAG: hypothetical protein RIT81_17715 [Deltaproteobacteria bacterium]
MKRRPRDTQRGYALLAVFVLLAVASIAAVTAANDSLEAAGSLRGARTHTASGGALDHGVALGLAALAREDLAEVVSDGQFELFGRPIPAGSELATARYPDSGPEAGMYQVRVGMRRGQRARAAPGEDLTQSYGQVVILQVGVEADVAPMLPVERQVEVGVVIPRTVSHTH